MIKTILFDMDGTLLDTEKHYNRFWKIAARELGYNLDDKKALEIRSLNREDGTILFTQWFGDKDAYDKIRKLRVELMTEYLANNPIELKPGALECLKWLTDNGYKTALVTATKLDLAVPELEQVGLLPYLSELVSARDVPHGKPHPDPYISACDRIGELPANCFAVEDSPNGIRSAHSAGCHTIFVPDLAAPEPEILDKIDIVLDSLHDLPEYLQGLQ